jgi:hypothetical protein
MSGLAHIQTYLKSWDISKDGDYKIRNLAFVCPSESYNKWDLDCVRAYILNDTIYGFATYPAQTRLGKCATMMEGAKLYRISSKAMLHHVKTACAQDTPYLEAHEKLVTKQCYREYIDSLYK